MAAGAVGASAIPEAAETAEPMLVCRLDVLGLLNIDPDLDVLVAVLGVGFGWTATRVLPPFWLTVDC